MINNVGSKICKKCREEKFVSEFYKHKTNRDGLSGSCKSCVLEQKKKWAKANPEKIRARRRVYKENNPEMIKREKKRYYKANKGKVVSYLREYKRKRKAKDPVFKLKHDLNKGIKKSLNNRGCIKKSKTIDILGISIDKFYEWLNGKASNGLHVDNGNFHLDHVVPISLANNENEVKLLSHYSNLQLLSPKNNFKKKNTYIYRVNLNRVLKYHPYSDAIQNMVSRSGINIIN